MPSPSKDDDLRKDSTGEILHRVTRFVTKASVGVLGSGELSAFAGELFDLVVTDPGVKRRDRFLQDIALRVADLEKTGQISIEDLLDNNEAGALLLRATQAAMRSSGEMKYRAIRSAAETGLIGSKAKGSSTAQTVIGFLDRMTEYHVVRLAWEAQPRPSYTVGQVKDPSNHKARSALFYGQPVYSDAGELVNPHLLRDLDGLKLYVEGEDYSGFQLAGYDLQAMGLLEPIYGQEAYTEGRERKLRPISRVVGWKISKLGEFVRNYIKQGDVLP